MYETPGKARARSHFYRTFLPAVLPESELSSGHYLVLLGKMGHELALLDELGVPRGNIYSVEREPTVVETQVTQSNNEVNLIADELVNYIQQNLQSNKRFLVLNLDIFGSYLNGIDPAMTTLLTFARRNPQTAIATYTSAGRDDEQLSEGLKSLMLFMWYDAEATTETTARLLSLYKRSGLSSRVAWNLILRHYFWLRSHMEHVAASAHGVGRATASDVVALLDEQETAWQAFTAQASSPLRYMALRHLVEQLPAPSATAPVIDVGLLHFQLMTYAASGGYYHNCYYSLYTSLPQMLGPAEWLAKMLAMLLKEPPVFVNREGVLFEADLEERVEPKLSTVLWRNGLDFETRRVVIPPQSEILAMNIVQLGASLPLDKRTIAKIYRLVEKGLATKEILPHLPPGVDPKRVTAHVAVARRGRKSS